MVMPRLLLQLTFNSGLVFSTLWKRITDAEKKVQSEKPLKKKTGSAVTKKAKTPVKSAQKLKKSTTRAAKPVKKVAKKKSTGKK